MTLSTDLMVDFFFHENGKLNNMFMEKARGKVYLKLVTHTYIEY